MKTYLTLILGLSVVSTANAHFPFILPSSDGSTVQMVFSDSLGPDKRASIDRIAATNLFGFDATGKKIPIKLVKQQHTLTANVSGRDVLVLAGFTDRGFVHSKHTDDKPVWIKHYPKAILGDLAKAAKVRVDEHVPLELVPVVSKGQLRFQARWQGKPLPKVEVSVLAPGEAKSRATTTDADGITNESFSGSGRYGARVGFIEQATGELAGNKYEEIRSYATLVLDFAPAGL